MLRSRKGTGTARGLLIILVLLISLVPSGGRAIVINNGLAPPNPENVIDYDICCHEGAHVFNDSLGAPTTVALVDAGFISTGALTRS